MPVAVATNGDGTDKLPLLFVGTSAQPRCFLKQQPKHLGVNYVSSKKGWMTRDRFRAWVQKLNDEMKASGRRILLLLDNASQHKLDEQFSNIDIQMLPPNTTAALQPQDAGVIAALKAWFKRRQSEFVLARAEEAMQRRSEGEVVSYDVDVLQAMRWCQEAWESVSQSSIANCWKHTGILPDDIYDLIRGISSVLLSE